MKRAYFSSLAACLLGAGAAWGEEVDLYSMSLEELLNVKISASSFFDQTANQSTGSSWVFTREELAESPVVFLKDVFELYAPSIAVGFSTFSGAVLGVRGIAVSDNDKTLFLVNGQNLNQVSLYGYQAGMQSTLFGDIDHIEVVNGPGAILHGSGAINNILNVIPKNGADYEGVELALGYGAKDRLEKFEVGYGKNYGSERNLYFYAGLARSEGFEPDSYLELGREAPVGVDSRRRVYEIPENYRLAGYLNWDDFEFQTQFQRVSRSFNKGGLLSHAGVWRGHWQTYWASRLKYNWRMDGQRRVEFSIPLEFYDHGVQLNRIDGAKGGRESHTGLKSTLYQEWSSHKLAVGLGTDYRSFDAQKQYFESNKRLLEESLTGALHKYEVFAEDVWQINKDWTASIGVRYDDINYGDFFEPEAQVDIFPKDLSAFTTRVATAIQIDPHNTIKAAYQEGFRYPDVSYFLTFGLANAALLREELEPLPEISEETVESFELSFLQSNADYTASWELNLYYNIHNGTLSWVNYSEEMLGAERYAVARSAIGFGPGAYANATRQFEAYGAEIGANLRLGTRTKLRGSYAYARPSGVPEQVNATMNLVNDSGKWANHPEHIFKLACNWDIAERADINLTTYYSPQVDIRVAGGEGPFTNSERFHQQDRLRFNARVNYRIGENSELSLVVQNLFEDEGPPVGFDTRDGTGQEGGLGDDSRRAYLRLRFGF